MRSTGTDFGDRENQRHLIVGRVGIAAEAVPGPGAVVTRNELPPRRIIWRARQSAASVKGDSGARDW